jgi:hypothetical protein
LASPCLSTRRCFWHSFSGSRTSVRRKTCPRRRPSAWCSMEESRKGPRLHGKTRNPGRERSCLPIRAHRRVGCRRPCRLSPSFRRRPCRRLRHPSRKPRRQARQCRPRPRRPSYLSNSRHRPLCRPPNLSPCPFLPAPLLLGPRKRRWRPRRRPKCLRFVKLRRPARRRRPRFRGWKSGRLWDKRFRLVRPISRRP